MCNLVADWSRRMGEAHDLAVESGVVTNRRSAMLDAIRELHSPTSHHCGQPWCLTDDEEWPCRTTRILDGEM